LKHSFVNGPIAEFLGPFEFNEISQQILRGEFDIDLISDDIQLHAIVKAMAHSDPTNPLESDNELSIEKLGQGFSYMKKALPPTQLDFIMVSGKH
jgi:hypothetical protein